MGLKSLLPFSLFVLALGASDVAHASELDGVLLNNQAVRRFKQEQPVEALDGFSKSLGHLPDQAEVHFNIATSFMALKEDDKALKEYDVALRLGPAPELAYKIHYNRAQILASKKQTAEALRSYQEALKVRPDSKEVKTNIELLMMSGEGSGEGENNDDKQNQNDKQNQDQKQNQQNQQQQQQQYYQQTQAANQQAYDQRQRQIADFNNAFSACMKARNYTVN
mgnify:CR=1 FL=1